MRISSRRLGEFLVTRRVLSRDVLEGSEDFLRVQLVPPCGWTDLGTPRRVAECLGREVELAPARGERTLGPPRLDVALAARAALSTASC